MMLVKLVVLQLSYAYHRANTQSEGEDLKPDFELTVAKILLNLDTSPEESRQDTDFMMQARALFDFDDPPGEEDDGDRWWSVAYYLAHTPGSASPEQEVAAKEMADKLNIQHGFAVRDENENLLKQLDAIGVLRMMLGGGGLLRATLGHRTGETFGHTKLAPRFPLAVPYWDADNLRRGPQEVRSTSLRGLM